MKINVEVIAYKLYTLTELVRFQRAVGKKLKN